MLSLYHEVTARGACALKKGLQGLAMLRSQLQGSPHGALDNMRLIRTSTAVSRRAEPHGSVPGYSDIGPIHSLQVLPESRQHAHTTDATDNGSLAVQYRPDNGLQLHTI